MQGFDPDDLDHPEIGLHDFDTTTSFIKVLQMIYMQDDHFHKSYNECHRVYQSFE